MYVVIDDDEKLKWDEERRDAGEPEASLRLCKSGRADLRKSLPPHGTVPHPSPQSAKGPRCSSSLEASILAEVICEEGTYTHQYYYPTVSSALLRRFSLTRSTLWGALELDSLKLSLMQLLTSYARKNTHPRIDSNARAGYGTPPLPHVCVSSDHLTGTISQSLEYF